jgi:hypothetical protein
MVKLPPSSILRAAPKKRLGFSSALASTPPESNFPDEGEDVFILPLILTALVRAVKIIW